jgi:Tol biopolymer transport system component
MMRIACLLAVVTAVGLAPTAAFAGFHVKNGKIAFASDAHGDFDIWTMNPDGGELVNLTKRWTGDEFAPDWRADGRVFAFNANRRTRSNPEADHEIFALRADGSRVRQITSNALDDEDPSWSPDGGRMAFARDFDPVVGEVDYDLYTMDADGGRQRNLTNSPGVTDYQPSWSPDGRRLVFLSDRDGDLEIYTSDTRGADVRQLTFNDASEFVPNWSPDGKRIVFATDRDDGNFEIYTMRSDGAGQTPIAFHEASEGYPAWSPDGNEIVFASDRDGEAGGFADLYTMRTDGSRQTNLTSRPGLDLHPDWQPLPRR